MKLFKFSSISVGLFYFLVLLALALWVRDIPYPYDAFTLSAQDLVRTSNLGDPASFATAAIDIAKNGWISVENDWIFNLWPPGFMLLEALIIKTLGFDAPVLLVLQILAAGLFSIVLTLLYSLMRDNVDWKFAISLPMIIFAFPVSRVFLLQPTGVTLGESFAIGFFLGGILLTLCSVLRGYIRYAAYAGFCFALSAYSRSQFEIILLALTGWGILLVIVVLLSRSKVVIEPKFSTSVVRTIVVALLVAHAATLPWRIYHLIYQGSPQWVSTSSLTFRNSVSTSEELEKVGAGWVVAGGGNLTCRIDPTTCGDTANAKHLFVKTFFTHPLEWYSRKFEVIGSYWFSSVQNWSGVGVGPTLMDFTTNALLLVVLAAIIFYLWLRKMRNHSSWILLVWFNVSLLSAYFLIFTFAHFEVRYFYFPKISIITMFLVLSGLYFSRQGKHPGRSHSGSAQFP